MERQQAYYIDKVHTREISIKDFFDIIKRGIWVIFVMTIISGVAGYFVSGNDTLMYQTETRVIIDSDSEYMKTLMVMIKDPLVMEEVRDNLQLTRSPESIAGQVDVVRLDESQVVKISVIDQDPMLAVKIANATATAFKSKAAKILEFEEVQLLSSAKENSLPINTGNQYQKIIALSVFGLITGIVLVFIWHSLDETIKKDQEVEDILGVPVLGNVSKVKNKDMRKRELRKENYSVEVEGDIGDLK